MKSFFVIISFLLLVACGSDDNGTSSTATGGTSSTATGGTSSTATGGTSSTATGGTSSTATGGTSSVATGGTSAAATGGTSSAANGGTSSAGTAGASASIARVLSRGIAAAASGPKLHVDMYLANVSQSDFDLTKFALRYWFTAELTPGATIVAEVGSGLFGQRVSVGTVEPARQGADHYIEVTWEYGGIITGAKEGVSFEAYQTNGGEFRQADDYSLPSVDYGEELVTIGVYRDGILIAGIEPAP